MTSRSVESADQLMRAVAGVPRVRIIVELEFRLSDDSTRWFEVVATNMLDVDDVHGIVLQSRDITERRELQATLERMTKTESLTGLLNRRGVLEGLDGWLERRRAAPGTGGFGGSVACFVDLDDFKSINDRFGHASGDAVLVAVGERMRALVEGRGFAGRMGGDEFVLLVELPDEAERLQFLQDLGRTLEGVIHHEDRDIPYSGSVGTIDLNPGAVGELDAFAILREADSGLRIAKARRHPQPTGSLD